MLSQNNIPEFSQNVDKQDDGDDDIVLDEYHSGGEDEDKGCGEEEEEEEDSSVKIFYCSRTHSQARRWTYFHESLVQYRRFM